MARIRNTFKLSKGVNKICHSLSQVKVFGRLPFKYNYATFTDHDFYWTWGAVSNLWEKQQWFGNSTEILKKNDYWSSTQLKSVELIISVILINIDNINGLLVTQFLSLSYPLMNKFKELNSKICFAYFLKYYALKVIKPNTNPTDIWVGVWFWVDNNYCWADNCCVSHSRLLLEGEFPILI